MVGHTCNPSNTPEAEVGETLRVQGQPELLSKTISKISVVMLPVFILLGKLRQED